MSEKYDFSKLPVAFMAEVTSLILGDPNGETGAYAKELPESPHVEGEFIINAVEGIALEKGKRYVCVQVPHDGVDVKDTTGIYIYALAEVRCTTQQEDIDKLKKAAGDAWPKE